MNESETKCLDQDDIRLFHKGACHIFAIALKAELPEEHYALKRVSLKKGLTGLETTKEAYHVYATKSGFMVDACGAKREEDYLSWLTARHREENFGLFSIPMVKTHDITEEELLTQHRHDPTRGIVNRWDLFSGSEFVASVRSRANSLISHWKETYCVSIVEAGFALRQK